ncbi:MAG: DUF1552 domain-containing protein [Deltaproteobacteria bacterium]|nr:DUF1552 domain-containing protein [Deltaproteobacteria bacterium]
MTSKTISRRTVLRGAAGSAIALPLLEAMQPRAGWAATAPLRFIVVAVGNGTFPERFWPTPPGGKTFPADYKATDQYSSGDSFIDTNQHTLSPILMPLADFKQRMLVLEGIDNCSGKGGHSWYGSLLTNMDPAENEGSHGQSFDQYLAGKIGSQTKFPSLQFGALNGDQEINYGTLSWSAPNRRLAAENDPRKMFTRLFGNASTSKPLPTPGPDTAATLRARRRSILNGAMEQMKAIRSRLGSWDQQKFDHHLDSLAAVEKQFTDLPNNVTPVASLQCGTPEVGAVDLEQDAALPVICKAQIDQIAMAVACDLSRVITLQIGHEGNNLTHPWLGITQPHHTEIGHGDDSDLVNLERMVKIGKWHAEQVAYLVQRLDAIKEGDGTALDNTLVLWVNGLSKGNAHCNGNIPTVLLGNHNKQIKSGRYVRFKRDPNKSNYPFNIGKNFGDLFVTVAKSMGLDLKSFGDPDYMNGGMNQELLA